MANQFPQGYGYPQPQPYNGQSYVANGHAPAYHQQPKKKRSGCKAKRDKNGNDCIIGWNKSRSRGFISFIAAPHKKKSKNKSPDSETWMVKVTQGITIVWHVGFYNTETRKLTIPDLNMVANPNAANGGYFGTFLKK